MWHLKLRTCNIFKKQTNKQTYTQTWMRRYSLFSSSSFISSGTIFNLSTWSRSTLAHFCSDSIMFQGLDISTTNMAKQLGRDWAETANLSRPLWYRSPSRIQTLQRVRSAKGYAECLIFNTVQIQIVRLLIWMPAGELTVSVLIVDI